MAIAMLPGPVNGPHTNCPSGSSRKNGSTWWASTLALLSLHSGVCAAAGEASTNATRITGTQRRMGTATPLGTVPRTLSRQEQDLSGESPGLGEAQRVGGLLE